MKKMLKRADGSTSQRGLWDNIRAKAASNKKAGKKGKAPSKDMLEQERKIEKKKMGGNWMEDSRELKFGGPTKYQTGKPREEVAQEVTPKYTIGNLTFSVGDLEPEKEKKQSGESRGGRTAGGGNKGGGSTGFDKSCLSGDCLEMMNSKGGKETNPQNQDGPTGLSKTPLYADRLANQTEEEKIAGLENKAKYDAIGEANTAKRKREAFIRSGRGMRSTGVEDTSEGVFPKYNYKPNFIETLKKFGGKRKSNKK
jgi:hypothetical protein